MSQNLGWSYYGESSEESLGGKGSSPVRSEVHSLLRKNFICLQCGAGYKYKRDWTRHVFFECNQEPQFSCPICGKKFKRNSALIRHKVNIHRLL